MKTAKSLFEMFICGEGVKRKALLLEHEMINKKMSVLKL
jgi:hypothetical protein